jgi:hypothetical protein
MLARSLGAVAAVLLEWAERTADDRAVAAETVLDRHDGQIDPSGSCGRGGGFHVGGAQQNGAGLVHSGSRCPDLLEVSGHAVVVVLRVVSQRLLGEVPEQLAHACGGRAVVQQ